MTVSKKQWKNFTRKIQAWFLLMTVIVLLQLGCIQPKSSQQVKLPSSSLPVEIIPPASIDPRASESITTPNVVLLKNQYPGMPPRIGEILQYCKRVCTDNWSGSLFGGERNPSNICMGRLTEDGSLKIVAHMTQSNPDGLRMDDQLAPDGSRCIYEVEQCTHSNGCLSDYDNCLLSNHKKLPDGSNPCYYKK